MEKDRTIEKIMKEHGLESPSSGFTGRVMEKIHSIPEQSVYKPLIGRSGRLFILGIVLSFIALSIIFSEPSGFLSERKIRLPEWELNLGNLPDLSFSTVLVTALLAVFILVVADAAINRRWFV